MSNSEEIQYLNAVIDIIENGDMKIGSNGYTKEIFGYTMKFDLRDGKLPLLTTKKINFTNILIESMWFLNDRTDNKYIQENLVKILDVNVTSNPQDYLKQILRNIHECQWCSFNNKCRSSSIDNKDKVKQMQEIITYLKDRAKRNSRHLIMLPCNSYQLIETGLQSCQFNVTSTNELSCILTEKNGDMGLDIPHSIALYATLVHILAHHCGLKPGKLIVNLGSAYVYEQHIQSLITQTGRLPTEFPTLIISNHREKIEDYIEDDFNVVGYNPHPSIKMEFIN